MFPLLVTLSVLCAPGALAQGWVPVDANAAKAFLEKTSAAIPKAHRTPAKLWPKIVPHLAEAGVLHGVDVVGLDDQSTHQVSQGWTAPGNAKALITPLGLALFEAEDAQCVVGECVFGASHFATHLAMRNTPTGQIRIVGVFETNSMVNEDRAEEIANAHAAWAKALDARYGAGPAAPTSGLSPVAVAPLPVVAPLPTETPLPAVAHGPPSAEAEALADARNRAGLEHLKARRFDAAIGAFEQAVQADPSYLLARYNLACALSLAQRFAESRAVLGQFQSAADCVGCQVRLFRARRDADFKAQRGDPAFRALVAGAQLPAVTARTATDATEALFTGQLKAISGFINPHGTVTVQITASIGGGVHKRAVRGHALAGTISELLGAGHTRKEVAAMFKMVCEGKCCRDTDDLLGHNALYIDKVCVKTDAAGWTTIDRIELTDGE